jgi:hypothetical protein
VCVQELTHAAGGGGHDAEGALQCHNSVTTV